MQSSIWSAPTITIDNDNKGMTWKRDFGKSKITPRMLCNRNGAISHLQNEMGLLRTSVTACAIDKDTISAPIGIFYVRTEI